MKPSDKGRVMNAYAKRNKLFCDVLILALLLTSLATISVITYFDGPQWDVISHELNGQTILNFLENHNVSIRAAFLGEFENNKVYYFEPYRAPLSGTIFSVLLIFLSNPIFVYLVLLFVFYVIAGYRLGMELGINSMLLFTVLLNPYTIYFLFIPNSTEALSLIFVFLGVMFLLRKSPLSGLFLGIATLAKYPTIILLPLIFLLPNRKKVVLAALFAILAVTPWLLFNYAVFGIPVYSYLAAITSIVAGAQVTAVHIRAVLVALAYPIIFTLVALVIMRRRNVTLHAPKLSYKSKVILTLVILSGIGYAFVLPHHNFFTQERFGYMLSASLGIMAAWMLTGEISKEHIPILLSVIAVLAITIMLYGAYYFYVKYNNPAVTYYNPDVRGNIYQVANSTLARLGFPGCRFISNVWVPMLYQRMNAYSPFILYTHKTIPMLVNSLLSSFSINSSTSNSIAEEVITNALSRAEVNYSQYVSEQLHYPIVVIDNDGVPTSFIVNLNASTIAYNSAAIQIYMPRNATCYRSA